MTDRVRLVLCDESVEPYGADDGTTRIHARRLVLRDDAGREVEVAALAWGRLGPSVAGLLGGPVTCDGEGPLEDDEVIVQRAALDARQEYVLVLLPIDEARRV